MPVAVDELETALEEAFGTRIASIERRRSPYRSFHVLDEVDVVREDGTALELILKDLSRKRLDESARREKPAFLYDPLREIEVYSSVLGRAPGGTARCYRIVADEARDRFWLVLERVRGSRLSETGAGPLWHEAARWLASLHTTCQDVRPRHALVHDRQSYHRWLRRACAVFPELQVVAGSYDEVVERLLAQPTVFLHGEFYASNVLVEAGPEVTRVCPVDWEMAAIGPRALDVAALTAGSWSDSERTELALAYRSALPSPPPEDTFLEELAWGRLHVAIQWLGWSRAWLPPPEHAHDWRREALTVARDLGLA